MAGKKTVILGPDHYQLPFLPISDTTTKLSELVAYPENIELVVFCGGEDIHPSLYKGVDVHGLCISNIRRDRKEIRIFKHCREHGIKMAGICRGLQFLNVMAGGFMYHHLEEHSLGDSLHKVYFPYADRRMFVTSTHHQLIGLRRGAIPIAWADPVRSQFYVGPKGQILLAEDESAPLEIEAAIFPKINAIGVQYHPEAMDGRSEARIQYEYMICDFLDMKMKDFINKYGRRKADGREWPGKDNVTN